MGKSEVDAFINEIADKLDAFAEKYGISGTSRNMIRFEAFSRAMGIKTLKTLNPNLSIGITSGMCCYDLEFSGHPIEVKVRYTKYDDDRISKNKIRSLEEDNAVVCVIFLDGSARCYRVEDWTSEGTWRHKNKTADDGRWVEDEYISYEPASALWTTNITLPYGDK